MAGTSLLTLLDDFAALLDDISVMTKVAAKKTAGVLGDDLALNAKQVQGIAAARELPVIWAVAKGSLKNKAIIVPIAMLLSLFAPWAILALLMLGGAYLCFEGAEKVWHTMHTSKDDKAAHEAKLKALLNTATDMVAYEKDKIKSAIRTDFILSAEILVISLSVVAAKSYWFQAGFLVLVALAMTLFVFGLVGGIIKLDDLGFYLQDKKNMILKWAGNALVHLAPKLMYMLTIVGTAAMFMVGGEFIVHGTPYLHHGVESISNSVAWSGVTTVALNSVVGLLVGALLVGAVTLFHAVMESKKI